MPEYLAPGVYVEETSYRSKSIEGVGTTTTGFVGPTRTGPITGKPELLTNFADFERIYGGLDDLSFGVNYLAHGVRAFFEEGGRRCYVMRVFSKGQDADYAKHVGSLSVTADATQAAPYHLFARFPGAVGNARVRFTLRTSRNLVLTGNKLNRVRAGDVLIDNSKAYFTVTGEGTDTAPWKVSKSGTAAATDPAGAMHRVTLLVEIERPLPGGGFAPPVTLGEFSLNDGDEQSLFKTFRKVPPTRFEALTIPFRIALMKKDNQNPPQVTEEPETGRNAIALLNQLFDLSNANLKIDVEGQWTDNNKAVSPPSKTVGPLVGGKDGTMPGANDYAGDAAGLPDPVVDSTDSFTKQLNGLLAFESVPDIWILAAPGYSAAATEDDAFAIQGALINHCEKMRYRIAVLDTPKNYLPTQALGFRNLRSSTHAAIYYPWIYVADPRPGKVNQQLLLPPSGFVAGIYARSDIENAVFKAPANEVVRLAVDFEQRLSKAHQELLNPNGVNCFRFFEGRGFLLWGARTISDDPEWKYVNVRRYFIYLEASIDRGTQWAVFENNNTPLWNNVKRTIEDFLYNEWRSGGLMGDKPEKGYFVRCDRSTMTQNDLDNGRLVCLIGVAPVKPAEFVIFRIGQWTADSPNT